MEAYGGRCAISRTGVLDVLQAAHIRGYKGAHSNHVSNGLLLRADIHNLFDMKMITIEPFTMKVFVSPSLKGTPYWAYNDLEIAAPVKKKNRPCNKALGEHFSATAAVRI
ncbi:HNH endonuclease [Methylobacterium sp. WL6]|nr:HNH endonuclease [Methylobacterium sp. WL6]